MKVSYLRCGVAIVKRRINQNDELNIHVLDEAAKIKDNSNEQIYETNKVDVFKHALDAIIVFNSDGIIVEANPAFCSILCEEEHRLLGKALQELVPVDKQYKLNRQKLLLQQNGKAKGILPIISPKGITYFETVTTFDKESLLNVSIMRDITHQRILDEHSSRENNFMKELFLEALDGIILWDSEGNIMTGNAAACYIFECPHHKLIGQNYRNLFNLVEMNFDSIIKEIKQTGALKNQIYLRLHNGKMKHIEFTCKTHSYDNYIITIFRDVSEKFEMQEQLRKSDRLNVIGELAAGIAHEIRNPMTALKGFIQLLEGSIKPEHDMYYQVITSELARIESIINEFLILAKPQAIRYQEKDINQIIRETVELLNAQAVLYNVQFHTQYDVNLPPLYCEPNQLKKVFINIIKNAIEVMPSGGQITINTDSSKKDYIHISIQDEGLGIPKEKIKKLGEPFYTTKERGTGLGLMVSYKIMEEHHGTIEIESEEEKGSIFHLYLPFNPKNRK
jgi:two-component system, sporulation sensor kinase E